MGGVLVLGMWSTGDEDPSGIKVMKRLRKEGIVTTDIVSLLFCDKTAKAKRIKDSGDVQKVEVKQVPTSRWPTSVASGNFTLVAHFATGNQWLLTTGQEHFEILIDLSQYWNRTLVANLKDG